MSGSTVEHNVFNGTHDSFGLQMTEIAPSLQPRAVLLRLIEQDREELQSISLMIDTRRRHKGELENSLGKIKENFEAVSILHECFQARIKGNEESLARILKKRHELKVNPDSNGSDVNNKTDESLLLAISKIYEAEIGLAQSNLEADAKKLDEMALKKHELNVRMRLAQFLLDAETKYLTSLVNHHQDLTLTISEKRNIALNSIILPDTILLHIFHQVLESSIEEARMQVDQPTNNITLTLTRVCRRWRYLVKDTPSLWRYIPLAINYTRNKIGKPAYYLSHVSQAQKLVFHWPLQLLDINKPALHLYAGFYSKRDAMHHYHALLQAEPLAILQAQISKEHNLLLCNFNSIEIIGRNAHKTFNLQVPAECYIIRELRPISVDDQ
ncbi:226_t:CDS:2, partial [Acaulospora colombiana]